MDRSFIHREVVPYWWCIGKECKHCIRFPNTKDCIEENRCIHSIVVDQIPEDHVKSIGWPILKIPMCPVFTDIVIKK
jgi:hypothetical protein